MAPTYEKRFIPRIVTKGLTCEGAASCTTLTTGAGSLTAPAIVCPTDADTGLYWDGKNLRYAADGAQTAAFTTAGLYGATLTTAAGSASAPAIVCPTDADTGLYWVSKTLRWGVDGARSFALSSSGPSIHGFGTPPTLAAYRTNGTEESPTAISDTAIMFQFTGYGYDGAAYKASQSLRFLVDGTPSSGIVPGGIQFLSCTTGGVSTEALTIRAAGTVEVKLGLAHQGSTLGFFNTTPTTKPTITGSREGNAALADLLTKLAGLGLLTDSTS